jgi:ATP-dependent helicase/nuclease subunit B
VYVYNKQSYILRQGDLFLISPSQLVSYRADPRDPWEYSWVGFNGTDARRLITMAGFSKKEPVLHCDDLEHTSHLLRQIIIQKAERSLASMGQDRTKYIVIVPEQYSMQTQRELVQEQPSQVLMNIDVLSFGRLAHRVFEETGVDRRTVLNDIGKSLLLRRVASRCAKDLQILQKGIHRPGMIDEVKSVLSEFMQYGIAEDQIEEMAVYAAEHGQNALQARLRDLKTIYREFRRAEKDSYVTSEETLDLLAKAIPDAESLRGSVIVFDGFTGFTTVQYRVVMALIRAASEVTFSFTVSGDGGPDIGVTAAGGSAGSEENLFYLSFFFISVYFIVI